MVDAAAAADRVLFEAAEAGGRLAGVADLGLGAVEGVRPRARGRGDARQAAQDVQRAAFGREEVAGAGGDGEELLARLHAVAVLRVAFDGQFFFADDRDDGFRDPEAGHDSCFTCGEVGGGHRVLGDRRHRRHVHAVGQVLLDGHVGDVLDLDGVEAGVGQELGECGVQAALQVCLVVRAAGTAVAAASGRGEGKVGGGHVGHCSWGAWEGRVEGKCVLSVVCTASERSGFRRTTM